ncbi:branched-chain amino acid ABC transporter permease [Achromobacter sp. GG226]|uniref:branched-chain amino acid ABC transporter permease n=1 Tax=Verticiella alkaliphila TaxID=2779529 RepID=UPI00209B0468|nr:branched-chain amino acid ABC transporter permease [Verticiella sp. GG226]MBU4610412.1 branched-chain amino acid ABC transporter permease [Verticiella sp. GG226]
MAAFFADVSPQMLLGQIFLGLINGSFYALMSLGLAIIFGMLHVVNFAHGAFYMLGAYCAWALLEYLGVNYWAALIIAPVVVAALGIALEKLMLRRLYRVDYLYALLMTFGLALVIEGLFRIQFGTSGNAYANPLPGGMRLGIVFLPYYRLWVIAASIIVCLATWFVIERTRLGAYLRAANENPDLVRAFGLNVPRMMMLTYGLGVGLAGFAGVMAAPVYQVSPLMGSSLVIVVFAVVVIGGMGSILGAIVTGFGLGVVEAVSNVFYPEGAGIVVFLIMILTLAVRPNGLFGKAR